MAVFASNAQTDSTKHQEELKMLIVKETKKGGRYDFFTAIKGHEYDGIQIKPGIFETKLGFALIKWGKVTYDLGVDSLETAYLIFSTYKGRETNEREKEYIKIGYNRELEN